MNSFFLCSPLEQFQIVPILSLHLGKLDISITNSSLSAFFIIFLFFFFVNTLLNSHKNDFLLIPSRWQLIFELLYKAISKMVVENVGEKGEQFFPFVFSLFLFVLLSNVCGLVPYSFTVTSHLIAVLTLAMIIFLGVNWVCVSIHGWKFFALFFPSGTSLFLGLLLVPIELISYIFKPISLSIRLFANMMAGHTLLKVVAGFSFSLMSCTGLLFLIHFVPLLVIIPLYGLELGVAFIQAYVFTLLTCIYINDSINLH